MECSADEAPRQDIHALCESALLAGAPSGQPPEIN